MKKMKTKAISFVTAFMLVFSLIPMLPSGVLNASAATEYMLSVAGISVTSENAADILGNGEASYDAFSNTLHLKKSFSSKNGHGIESQRNQLIIETDADVAITVEDYWSCLVFNGDATVTGKGKLTLKANGNNSPVIACDFFAYNSITIADANIELTGARGFANGDYIIRNSAVSINTNEIAFNAQSLTLENCKFVSPEGVKNRSYANGLYYVSVTDSKGEDVKNAKIEPTDEITVTRLAGKSRYETAVEISKEAFAASRTVILANSMNYADALAGVALAGYNGRYYRPILLTNTDTLDASTLAEIKRLKAEEVIILGGEGAISPKVVKALKANNIKEENIKRIAGKSRFGTAAAIAEQVNAAPEEVFFVYGLDYADALSVSPVSANKKAPVLYLTKDGELNAETAEYLKKLKEKNCVKNAYVIGGEGVISKDMMKKTRNALGVTPLRVFGANRFETCVAVNNRFADVLDGDMLCVATGMDFPDALAGGVFAAMKKAPLFLINGKAKTPQLSDEQKAYLKTKAAGKITAFGGVGVVPDNHIEDIAKNSI